MKTYRLKGGPRKGHNYVYLTDEEAEVLSRSLWTAINGSTDSGSVESDLNRLGNYLHEWMKDHGGITVGENHDIHAVVKRLESFLTLASLTKEKSRRRADGLRGLRPAKDGGDSK